MSSRLQTQIENRLNRINSMLNLTGEVCIGIFGTSKSGKSTLMNNFGRVLLNDSSFWRELTGVNNIHYRNKPYFSLLNRIHTKMSFFKAPGCSMENGMTLSQIFNVFQNGVEEGTFLENIYSSTSASPSDPASSRKIIPNVYIIVLDIRALYDISYGNFFNQRIPSLNGISAATLGKLNQLIKDETRKTPHFCFTHAGDLPEVSVDRIVADSGLPRESISLFNLYSTTRQPTNLKLELSLLEFLYSVVTQAL